MVQKRDEVHRDPKPDKIMPRVVVAAPCPRCPFRHDVPSGGHYLRAARAAEIVQHLRRGVGFLCHETATAEGPRCRGRYPLQCAGAALLIEKEGRSTQPILLAKGLNLWQSPRDDRGVLVDSLDDFIAHHTPPKEPSP